MFHVPNNWRDRKNPQLSSDDTAGNNGFFIIPHPRIVNYRFLVKASDGEGWEHISVSVCRNGEKQTRCPTWEEMCIVKDIFWDKQDCTIQYHPSKSEYVNAHPYVLYIWRPTDQTFPIPDKTMVG